MFFKQELNKLTSGSILLPAEGEGRNAVFAACNSWKAFACGISKQGKIKAEKQANKLNVTIDYKVGDFGEMKYPQESFDAVALVYAHFPPNKRSEFHNLVDTYLKPGGTIIFEAFGKKYFEYNAKNPKAGGPKALPMLFSVEEIKNDFTNYEIFQLEEVEIELAEGQFHTGKGSVVRFAGRKL